MVLLNVKRHFTLADLLAEDRKLADFDQPLPICKSLLDEAIRLMMTVEAAQQQRASAESTRDLVAPRTTLDDDNDDDAAAKTTGLAPVLPPKSPRPMVRHEPLRRRMPSFLDDHPDNNKELGGGHHKPSSSWQIDAQEKDQRRGESSRQQPQQTSRKPMELLMRAVYASVVVARFRKRWANRIGPSLNKTLATGKALVRKTSFRLKEHLKAYSVVEEIERKLENNLRKKRELEKEASEREHMRLNERLARATEMHRVDVRDVFFVKIYNFLKVTTFMNHARDIMVVVTRPNTSAIYPVLYLAEADLTVAANEFYARTNKFKEVAATPIETPEAIVNDEDLLYAPELPDYAAHYIFMLGRLTMLDDSPALLGVENVVDVDQALASRRITRSALGSYQALALQDWRPVDSDPDPKMKLAFVNALIEAKELVSGGSLESEQLRQIQRDLQQHTSVMQDLNERDAIVINHLLTHGVAPTQRLSRVPSPHANTDQRSDSMKKKLVVRPTTAGAWRRTSSRQQPAAPVAFGHHLDGVSFGGRRETGRLVPATRTRPTSASSKTIPKTTSSPALIKSLGGGGAKRAQQNQLSGSSSLAALKQPPSRLLQQQQQQQVEQQPRPQTSQKRKKSPTPSR